MGAGERPSRLIEQRCARCGPPVITGGLRPDHTTVARFWPRTSRRWADCTAKVLRLLATEGMVLLGKLSLDSTSQAGSAAQKASRTLP